MPQCQMVHAPHAPLRCDLLEVQYRCKEQEVGAAVGGLLLLSIRVVLAVIEVVLAASHQLFGCIIAAATAEVALQITLFIALLVRRASTSSLHAARWAW